MAAGVYDAGIVEGEQPSIIHAAQLKSRGPDEPGYHAAVCNAMTLVPIPDRFAPNAPNACPDCRGIATDA